MYWAGSPVNDWLGPGRRALYTPDSTLDTLHNHHPFESKQGAPPPSLQKNYNPCIAYRAVVAIVCGGGGSPTTRIRGWRGSPLYGDGWKLPVVGCIRGCMSTSQPPIPPAPPAVPVPTRSGFYATGPHQVQPSTTRVIWSPTIQLSFSQAWCQAACTSVARLARLTADSFPVAIDGAGAVPIAAALRSDHHFN